MVQAKIIIENPEGLNNTPERYEQYAKMGLYRNLSTVWVTPGRGTMATRTAINWTTVMSGFNAPLARILVEGFEVGAAYNEAVKQILGSPLGKFEYMLTVEEDNTPPSNGLHFLLDSIQQYDVVGGLYWTKGPGGVPMIWGDPATPYTYVPQPPKAESIQQCNGLGMGFTLFRMDLFRNPAFKPGSWFKTGGDKPGEAFTQDLYFFKRAAELGYKFACDTRCRVGHYDHEGGTIW